MVTSHLTDAVFELPWYTLANVITHIIHISCKTCEASKPKLDLDCSLSPVRKNSYEQRRYFKQLNPKQYGKVNFPHRPAEDRTRDFRNGSMKTGVQATKTSAQNTIISK